jgi:hypothetical protein
MLPSWFYMSQEIPAVPIHLWSVPPPSAAGGACCASGMSALPAGALEAAARKHNNHIEHACICHQLHCMASARIRRELNTHMHARMHAHPCTAAAPGLQQAWRHPAALHSASSWQPGYACAACASAPGAKIPHAQCGLAWISTACAVCAYGKGRPCTTVDETSGVPWGSPLTVYILFSLQCIEAFSPQCCSPVALQPFCTVVMLNRL